MPIRPARKSRQVRGTPMASYLWEQVPRQLLSDAKNKARSQGTSVKAVLITLLRDWTYAPEPVQHRRPDGEPVTPAIPVLPDADDLCESCGTPTDIVTRASDGETTRECPRCGRAAVA